MPHPSRRSFTLIETLLTLSMFSLIMSVLLAGLSAGTKAWRKADASLIRSVALRQALGEFVRDLERLHYQPESRTPVIAGGLDEAGRPALRLLVMDERAQRAPLGSVCQTFWSLKDADDGKTLDWVRTDQALAGGAPCGDPQERVILGGVKAIICQYWSDGRWVEKWDDPEKPPTAVRVRVELDSAPRAVQWAAASTTGGAPK